ncbi:hypothetical protein AB0C34_02680 [Nocardia sp. NPDC049220]|uniref:hypothetical protein n=1 Tax=Nocardia sp. NPDC049220 TaxID=3155273 RepID=UPI0033D35A2A
MNVANGVERLGVLPHCLVAFRGFLVIVPVRSIGEGIDGIRFEAPDGLLPEGGRRAGLVADRYNAQCLGPAVRFCTGWLEVSAHGANYAPHTFRGLSAPAVQTVRTPGDGRLAERGLRRARRDGTLATLNDRAARLVETTS